MQAKISSVYFTIKLGRGRVSLAGFRNTSNANKKMPIKIIKPVGVQ